MPGATWRRWRRASPRAGLRTRTLVAGSRPATAILDVAEQEQVDLIMLATHGRGGLDRLVVGSVADRVLHHSPCPAFLLPVRERQERCAVKAGLRLWEFC